ncbi:MAG: hypothetical protein ACRCV9_04050 [Burkholderiaceae bacterium]
MSRPRCEVRVAVAQTLPTVFSSLRSAVTVRDVFGAMPAALGAHARPDHFRPVMPQFEQVRTTMWNMSRAGELERTGDVLRAPGCNRGLVLFRPGPRLRDLVDQCDAGVQAVASLQAAMRGWFGGDVMRT